MKDANISDDLRQLAHGQVKAREFSRYDIGGYRFRTAKLEASRPLAATTNSGVVTSAADASGHVTDYYGVLQKIIEYTFGGAKELRVVFFDCEWFDQSPTLEWMNLVWWRSSTIRAFQASILCLHIKRNRCTT